MINTEQAIRGLERYLDAEVMPHIPTLGKWIVGAAMFRIINSSTLEDLAQNKIIQALGITDGVNWDADALCDALMDSAKKYGKAYISLPMIGDICLEDNDIEKLRMYLR